MGDNEITKNLEYLTENLKNLHGVLTLLLQERIISRNEKDQIMLKVNTPMESNDKLLAILVRKDWQRVRGQFLKILRRTTNEHCADAIEGKESQATDNEIIKNFVYLAEHLTNLQVVLLYLLQDEIISRNEREEIEHEKTAYGKNIKLLTFIQKKDWHRVRDLFLEILRKTHNEHCADKIEGIGGQVTGIKQIKRGNDNKKSTKSRVKNSDLQIGHKIYKWWPEEKKLIESLYERKKGDKLLVQELHDRIQNDKNRTVVICESAEATKYSGMGGIGKTLTAKWYARHYKEYYDHILWIDCGEDSLLKSFETLARDLDVKNRKELFGVEAFSRKCFESLFGFKCLWIYDNVERYQGEEGIIKVLPNHQNFFCLITSRSREWGIENLGYGKVTDLQLEIFSQQESLDFLKSKLKEEIKWTELEELNELCRQLGNLPLALQLAVAALNNSHMDVKTYNQKSKVDDVLDAKFDDYEKTINGNVKVSLDLIEKEKCGKTAKEILMIFGYIRPDDIQLQFFKSALQIKDDMEIKESVKLLTKYSLVAKTELMNDKNEEFTFLSVHRLLQQVVRHNSKDKETNYMKKIFKGNKENQILRKILGCEGFIDYKLLPFTNYADENIKKEFSKVKAQLLDQRQLRKLKRENRFDECVELSKFIHQELQKPATTLNYAICLHENKQLDECVKTAEVLLAKFPLRVKDDQLSSALNRMLVYLKSITVRVDVKRIYYLMDLCKENNDELREDVGDLLLFSYLRLKKINEAIVIGQQTASHKQILAILTAVMTQKRYDECVQLAQFIDQELKTKTAKLNYAICLQKNGQWEDSVATLHELHQQEMEEKIKYYYSDDVEMGLYKLDREVSRELVGGHLLLTFWTMDTKGKIKDLLNKTKEFKFIHSAENLHILIRLVHSHLIHSSYSLVSYYSPLLELNLDVETKKIKLSKCSLSLDSFDRLSPEELTLENISFFRDGQELEEVKANDFLNFTNIRRLTLKCDDRNKNLSIDLSGYNSFDYLELCNCSLSLDSSELLSPEELTLENVSFFRDDQEIEDVKANDFLNFTNIRRLTLKCDDKNKNLSIDLSGDSSFDYLELWNLRAWNCNNCHWKVKELNLWELPFVEKTSIEIEEMIIGCSSLDVSCLPRTILKLTLSQMKEVFAKEVVQLPNLKFLTLEVVDGLSSHFRSAPLTHIDLNLIKEVNVALLPETLNHLHITNPNYDYARVVGGVRTVENLTLKEFTFTGVEECLSHFRTNNLLIQCEVGRKELMELMKKTIKKIVVGPIKWDKDEFKNYSTGLDRQAGYYLLEGKTGMPMEEKEFKKLSKINFTNAT